MLEVAVKYSKRDLVIPYSLGSIEMIFFYSVSKFIAINNQEWFAYADFFCSYCLGA